MPYELLEAACSGQSSSTSSRCRRSWSLGGRQSSHSRRERMRLRWFEGSGFLASTDRLRWSSHAARNYRGAALFMFCIPGRKEDNHIPVDGITCKVPFQRIAAHLNALHGDGLCPRHSLGQVGLHLGGESSHRSSGYSRRDYVRNRLSSIPFVDGIVCTDAQFTAGRSC